MFRQSAKSLGQGSMIRHYKLIGADGEPYQTDVPGSLGGYRPRKIYGTLDCYSAKLALAKGGYAKNRVFFADEATAIAAGYRPCAKCMNTAYRLWKKTA